MTVESDADLVDRLYAGAADPDLDGIRMVRGLVARVRDEMPGVEPPPSISARLLQAAAPARAAVAVEPDPPGVWARLRMWFAQPAVAAMATLVLVAGAAALWMRQGKPASPSISTTEVRDEPSERASSDLAVETRAPTSALPPAPTPPPPRKAPASKSADKPAQAPVAKTHGGDEAGVELDTTTSPPPAPPPPSNPAPAPSANEDARRLTRQAVVAGQQGDCTRVKELAKQVKKLDPEWYAAGFLPEPGIRDCVK